MANESELTDGSGYMTRSKRIPPQIQHDIENLCFFTDLGTSRAFLSYTQIGNIMQMEHTEVPSMYAGKGLGKLLAKVRCELVHAKLKDVNKLCFSYFLSLCSLPLNIVLEMVIECV